jgi:two-component sensor histidine kinase
MSWEGSDAAIWNAERLRSTSDAAGIALWSWNVDTNQISMDQRGYVMWGITKAGPLTFEELSSRIHLPDRKRVRTVFEATRAKPGPYEVDFPITFDGGLTRWISARGLGADEGIVAQIMFGVFLDVTTRKQAEEVRDMLAEELHHRIKNLFSVASLLTSLAARSAVTSQEMEDDLQRRLLSLGRAQELIRLHPGEGGPSAQLGALFEVLLAPYDNRSDIGDRIHVVVPDMQVGKNAGIVVALLVHELATNSTKHGALSVASGRLDVSYTDDNGEIAIVWTERGGPRVTTPTGPMGFGTKLVSRCVSGQLGGTIAFDWAPEGAIVTMRMSKARLAA